MMPVGQHISGVDPMLSIIMDRAFAEHVASDFGDDGGLRAQRAAITAVGALAAEPEMERLTSERFPAWQPRFRKVKSMLLEPTTQTRGYSWP